MSPNHKRARRLALLNPFRRFARQGLPGPGPGPVPARRTEGVRLLPEFHDSPVVRLLRLRATVFLDELDCGEVVDD